MAVGDWNVYTYANDSWSKGYAVQETFAFTAISCSGTDFCIAVDNDGNAYTDWKG